MRLEIIDVGVWIEGGDYLVFADFQLRINIKDMLSRLRLNRLK